jgi:hypothetical protein
MPLSSGSSVATFTWWQCKAATLALPQSGTRRIIAHGNSNSAWPWCGLLSAMTGCVHSRARLASDCGVANGSYCNQGCQFRSVLSGIAKTFHTNSKIGTKRNKFHLILNLGPLRIFRLNSTRNVPVSFHMFRSALEKPLNQIEPCSI